LGIFHRFAIILDDAENIWRLTPPVVSAGFLRMPLIALRAPAAPCGRPDGSFPAGRVFRREQHSDCEQFPTESLPRGQDSPAATSPVPAR
jgi:hypothetical protein